MDIAKLSCKGNRDINEDYVGSISIGNNHLLVLADGLGGHDKGEVASKLVVETAIEEWKNGNNNISMLFESCQKRLCEKQDMCGVWGDMKTTLVIAQINSNQLEYGHIGDSRLYVIKGKKYERTVDHSVPQMLVFAGEIKEKQIRKHPDRSRLLKVMGDRWESEAYDLSEMTIIEKGDAILMCSDGFWEYIKEREMIRMLKKALSAEDWLNKMEKKILLAGQKENMDNYSAIAVIV